MFCVHFIFEVETPGTNSCYIRVVATFQWHEAQSICSKINGSYIAVANACDELLEIQNTMLYNDGYYFWLGCSEQEDTGMINCLDNSSSYWNISSGSGVGYWRRYTIIFRCLLYLNKCN